MPNVLQVHHPLVAHRLATLRDVGTDNGHFRTCLAELSEMLVYEATRTLPTEAATVTTPLGPAAARRLVSPPRLVPVLRAGLGMLEGALRLLPDAEVGFVGLKRNEETLQPDSYLTALPADLGGAEVLVLDPMLATGGSLVATLELLGGIGVGAVTVLCVLAAPEGLARLDAAGFSSVRVVTASVDERLNEIGYIVPGLGDAGDRQFGAY
ncbi:MAG: uracil phosphoribosyltransferase [Acidimicrobiales bacterium]